MQQGEIDAYIASKVLNATKIYVIDDQEAYGRGLALLFKKYYAADGGNIVGFGEPAWHHNDVRHPGQSRAERGRSGHLLRWHDRATAAASSAVTWDRGDFNIPLLGGDGCEDTKFISDANSGSNTSEAEGSYATSAPDVTKLASSATFYSEYAAAYSAKPAPYNDGTKEPYTAVRLRRDEHPAAGHPRGPRCQRRTAPVRPDDVPRRCGRPAAPDVL